MSESANKAHIAVLMGGWSNEREISLVSGRACASALASCGYRVSEVDADRDVAARLKELAPDVVFNALHGTWGEDGAVQGVLETLDIPYTHSGVLASALAMDKALTRNVLAANGIKVAKGTMADRKDIAAGTVMDAPFVVKPNKEGSSVGVVLVREGDNKMRALLASDDWQYGDELLVEQFVPGRELSVAVLDGEALGVVEITSDAAFYDYDAKYAPGGSSHILPAPVPGEIYAEALAIGEQAHHLLGCRGVSRTDIRYDEDGILSNGKPALYVLELNTQPGMTPTSLVPEIAATKGYDFAGLCQWMVEDASCQR